MCCNLTGLWLLGFGLLTSLFIFELDFSGISRKLIKYERFKKFMGRKIYGKG